MSESSAEWLVVFGKYFLSVNDHLHLHYTLMATVLINNIVLQDIIILKFFYSYFLYRLSSFSLYIRLIFYTFTFCFRSDTFLSSEVPCLKEIFILLSLA